MDCNKKSENKFLKEAAAFEGWTNTAPASNLPALFSQAARAARRISTDSHHVAV